MQFLVNSDNSIALAATPPARDREPRTGELARFTDWLTRVEVHLHDVDGPDVVTGQGLEAMLEARPSGSQPLTVSHRAQCFREAVNGALAKLTARLETAFGKSDRVR